MSTTLAEVDEVRADAFYAQDNSLALVKKYASEIDDELRDNLTKLAVYLQAREAGVDPVFANMRACRRAPGATNCDRHFQEGSRRRMYGMGKNAEHIAALARKAGINTTGKYYVGGLGRYTDSHAWVASSDDVLEVARKRNLTVTGCVNHTGIDMPPPKRTQMAPDVMREYVGKYLRNDPATAERIQKNPKRIGELKEKILATHTKRRKDDG